MNKVTESSCLRELKRLNELKYYKGGLCDVDIDKSIDHINSMLKKIRLEKSGKRISKNMSKSKKSCFWIKY